MRLPLFPLIAASLFATSLATAQTPTRTTNGQAVRPTTGGGGPAAGGPSSPLYFSEDSTGSLYTLDPNTGASTFIGTSGVTSSTVGIAPRDGTTLFGSTPWSIHVVQGDGSGTALLVDQVAEALAYDPSTDLIYAFINASFLSLDGTTGGSITNLSSPGEDIEGIAFAHGGVYGIVGFAGTDTQLYFYDPGTDTWSVVGDTGIDWHECGLAYDPGGDVLYAKTDADSSLYRIDPVTAAVTVVGDTGLLNGGGLAWNGPSGGPIGTNYCGPANINSSGQAAVIAANGLTSVTSNFVTLDAAQMPTSQFGYFVNSMSTGFSMPPGSQGNLCLSGGIGRYSSNVLNTGAGGEFSLDLDLPNTPTPGGTVAIQAGETWYFQAWFRDGVTSNFTDGICITFD